MNKNELKHGFKIDVESLLQDQFYNPNVFFFLNWKFCFALFILFLRKYKDGENLKNSC